MRVLPVHPVPALGALLLGAAILGIAPERQDATVPAAWGADPCYLGVEAPEAPGRAIPSAPPPMAVGIEFRTTAGRERQRVGGMLGDTGGGVVRIADSISGAQAAMRISDLNRGVVDPRLRAAAEPWNREGYAAIEENPFFDPRSEPLSTFGIDVDRASYANIRRFLCDGRLPPRDAVRIEEMVNYFAYELPGPAGDAVPFAIHTEVSAAPWAPDRRLVRVGVQGRRLEQEVLPPSNLVFLLDVSGSMQSMEKLPLVKAAMHLLVEELRPEDRVSLVVYAGAAGLILEPTSGAEKETILDAIDRLEAGGSTAGGAGIRLAYATAREHFVEGGNNRVIIATDGDFNVGVSSDAEMTRLIEHERESGVFLSVLGVGTGNLQDAKMEAIANHGNGNYSYLDNLREARKVLVEEMESTLFTIAKDVKIQVEFNPERVLGYRLIGYENRVLAAEDFDDDRKDAGELGAGHTVTALYEVAVRGEAVDDPTRDTGPLRYQTPGASTSAADSDELLFLRLRWKAPDGDQSSLIETPVRDRMTDAPSADHQFSAAVAGFGMLLRDSQYRGAATTSSIRELAEAGMGEDPGGWRAEFLALLDLYEVARTECGDDCMRR